MHKLTGKIRFHLRVAKNRNLENKWQIMKYRSTGAEIETRKMD